MRDADPKTAKILIVDDEPIHVRLLDRLLSMAGYTDLVITTDPRRALELYRACEPDLIVLDLVMPHVDGVGVLKQLKAEMPDGAYIPVLVLTGDATIEAKRRALSAGANDFLTKPFEQPEVVLRIENLLNTRRLYLALEAQNRSLDQTVRERTERLVQSEKVATMGSLLAGVAHELNNPLAILMGQTQLLSLAVKDSALAPRVDKIEQAADRCVRIVRNFLALARQRPPERRDVRLPELVQGAIELLAYELRTDGIDVVLDLPDELPKISADPHQLHQVLVNLIANAYQAMRRQAGPRRIHVTGRYDGALERVRLEVTDSGPGIAPEIRARIFEPFFTTKAVGEGTGLGLSLCRGIVEEHGGTIEVDNDPSGGARFTIDLPVKPKAVGPLAPPEAAPPPSVGPKTMLVVDDEPDIAAIIAEALEHDGHKVDVAANGAVALGLLASRPYDLILSDTKMPVLDGEGFTRELRRRFPALINRLIFLTGDVLSPEKQEFLAHTGVPCVMKPCDLSELLQVVRRVLAAR